MILRKPGLSFGKVMILCGGPDWPTSVLCGLLKLSLISCEIGTTPIIFYIAPFSLSGSFLLRKNDGKIWSNASNVMLLITIVMTVVYWAACAWVIQNTFNEQHDELARKLPSNIELDWLDYREQLVSDRTQVSLREAPHGIRVVYVGGALIMLGTVQTFQWGFDYLFGTFKMTENDIDQLRWFEGDDRIVKPAGQAVLVALIAGFLGKIIFDMCKKKFTQASRLQAITEADAMESAWKEREREEREGAARITLEAEKEREGAAPIALEAEKDDPEKTPETYVPPAECNKDISNRGGSTPASPSGCATPASGVTGQSSAAQAQSARPQTLGRATDSKPKASTVPVMITDTE